MLCSYVHVFKFHKVPYLDADESLDLGTRLKETLNE